jgi:hypothetical protein
VLFECFFSIDLLIMVYIPGMLVAQYAEALRPPVKGWRTVGLPSNHPNGCHSLSLMLK